MERHQQEREAIRNRTLAGGSLQTTHGSACDAAALDYETRPYYFGPMSVPSIGY